MQNQFVIILLILNRLYFVNFLFRYISNIKTLALGCLITKARGCSSSIA